MNSDFNLDEHHRQSIRLKEYDYSQEGLYFVTICVQKYACLFGQITEGKMCLSEIGEITGKLWYEIKNHASNIELHEFVVMPNHLHGIIEIIDANVGARHALPTRAGHALPLQTRFQNPGKNTLSSIVGSYKSAVSKYVHHLGFTKFSWQRNYYEHIIRNADSYTQIAQYIINNPINWKSDKFHIS